MRDLEKTGYLCHPGQLYSLRRVTVGEGKAKGVKGSFLVLAEWKSNGGNYWKESTWTFVGAKMVRVDGKEVKENTWYSLINGEITEV